MWEESKIWAGKPWWEEVENPGKVGSFISNNTETTFLNTVKGTSNKFHKLMQETGIATWKEKDLI